MERGKMSTSQSKPKLGVDIDGVLCDMIPDVLGYIWKTMNIRMRPDDVKRWDFPVGVRSMNDIIQEALSDRDFLLGLKPISYAREGMQILRDKYDITIITSRHSSRAENTRSWVDRYFGKEFPVIHTDEARKHLHGMNVLIDDAPHNIEAFLANSGTLAIMYNQPWNVWFNPISRRFRRVWSWDDVIRLLMEEYYR